MKLFVKTAILALVASSSLSAICLQDELRLEGGYRHDEYKHDFSNTGINGGLGYEEFKVKNVDLGTFGIRGRFFFPQWDFCGCYDTSFLNNFYVTGFANWGWAGKESYSDTTLGALSGVLFEDTGKLSYVRTYDYNIGLGYFIDLGCWSDPCSCFDLSNWGLGISGGYQWDKQRYKVSTASLTIDGVEQPGADLYEEGLKIYQKWEGPWVGAQLFYEGCGWRADFGYEYHFCLNTKGAFSYTDVALAPPFEASDYNWKGHKGYSNVAFVNGYYDLCDGWDLGLGFKYQDWNSKSQSNSFNPDPGTVVDSSNNSRVWSYSVVGSVGYHF